MIPTWDQYRKMQTNPIVIDYNGDVYAYHDWNFLYHKPRYGKKPLRRLKK